ncbi:tricarboxylic transport [Salmonella enterica subsp. enterica]|uniref:Tricarboxylic transport n=1 Tax=Salmonella enterica I TaxID=59201 RepID=A0A379VLR3_SALET|nr:tricarboxylic transport [Salmonella enterica subsp. enterica]
MLFNLKEGAQCIGTTLRSSVIGFFVGVLPGAGATIASAITYMTEKKLSGNSDSFGKGDIRASRRRRRQTTPLPAAPSSRC